MSEFSNKILDAKKTQQKFIFKIILAIFLSFLISIISLFYIYSKKIVIKPKVNDFNLEFKNGKGLVFFKRILFLSDKITLKASSEGYEDFENSYSNDSINEISINFIKKDINLSFTTNTEIGTNKWFLDDKFISSEKILNLKIKPGRYTLRLENEFYKTKFLDFSSPNKMDKKNYKFNLERLKGYIYITTEPTNADIIINGKKVGKSPKNHDLLTGNYDLRIVKKGYQEISEKIKLNVSNLNYKKKYILAPAAVKINFNLQPEKGMMFINGKLLNNYNSLNLSTKKSYNFVYKKDGYLTKEKEFIFYENKINTVEFLLEKEYGEVNIISSPVGKIKIDGKDFGKTPQKIKLQTIKQKLEIIKEGFLSYETVIKPKSNELSKVEVKLEKEFDNIKRLSPENYINSIGIKMKLFSPGRFTMGAPRHEKGQRANEFLKEIILRKKFYSSLTEVTIEQFTEFKGKSNTIRNENLPISNVSWIDAISFCNWLSEKEGLDSVYMFNNEKYVGANLQNNGYRLPTEAEWEWLARKAERNSITKFSWGKTLPIPKMAGNLADESVIGFKELYIPNYKDNHRGLAPVGSFKRDISGLYDLTGNVKEWVHDYYLVSVPKSNMIYYDPSGPKKGVGHVVKGSSYLSATLQEVRASYRDSEVNKKDDIGFRIVRYLYGKEFKNNEK